MQRHQFVVLIYCQTLEQPSDSTGSPQAVDVQAHKGWFLYIEVLNSAARMCALPKNFVKN
jgi:hypothetical protein